MKLSAGISICGVMIMVIGFSGGFFVDGTAMAAVVYSENFDLEGAPFSQAGPPEVCWGGSPYIPESFNTPLCMSGRTLRTNSTTLVPVLGIDLRGYTNATLTYTYYQTASAYCNVQIKTATSGAMDCNQTTGFPTGQSHLTTGSCTVVNITLTPNAINYIRWKKSTGTNAIWFDTLSIDATATSPSCPASYSCNFGTTFYSGTVCANFPSLWENCAGAAGPYLTSMTPCGGSLDYCMALGQGSPYSSAETTCFSLVGASSAVMTYNYSWDGYPSLSPDIEISINNGVSWSTIVASHVNTSGACQSACINLSAYINQSSVKLRINSNTSSTSNHAYFDDFQLLLNQSCPTSTPTGTPTASPTPTRTATPPPTVTLIPPSPTLSPTVTVIPVSPTPTCTDNGDVNGDGELTMSDSQTVFEIALGMLIPNEREACSADCNGDDEITSGDAQLIYFATLGMGSCVGAGR